MVIFESHSERFRKYGRVVNNIDFAPVIEALEKIQLLIYEFFVRCYANVAV